MTPEVFEMAETGLRDYHNVELLDLIHAIERARLLRSADARTNDVVHDPWPSDYAALVNEAQRRKLCL
jgi:hypothetical protein